MTHLNENEVKSAVNEMMNDDATKALAAAKKAYPVLGGHHDRPCSQPWHLPRLQHRHDCGRDGSRLAPQRR